MLSLTLLRSKNASMQKMLDTEDFNYDEISFYRSLARGYYFDEIDQDWDLVSSSDFLEEHEKFWMLVNRCHAEILEQLKSNDKIETTDIPHHQSHVYDIDTTRLVVQPMVNDPIYGRSSQLLYNDDLKGLCTLDIQLNSTILHYPYGIPALHDRFCPTDDKRQFLKHPLDDQTKNGNEQLEAFEMIDKFMASEKTKKTIFGANYHKAVYIPCVRYLRTKNGFPGSNKLVVPYLKCTFKFSEKSKVLETNLTVNDKELKNDNGEILKLTSMTDVNAVISSGSIIKHIDNLRSIWIGEENSCGEIQYCLRMRIMRLDSIPLSVIMETEIEAVPPTVVIPTKVDVTENRMSNYINFCQKEITPSINKNDSMTFGVYLLHYHRSDYASYLENRISWHNHLEKNKMDKILLYYDMNTLNTHYQNWCDFMKEKTSKEKEITNIDKVDSDDVYFMCWRDYLIFHHPNDYDSYIKNRTAWFSYLRNYLRKSKMDHLYLQSKYDMNTLNAYYQIWCDFMKEKLSKENVSKENVTKRNVTKRNEIIKTQRYETIPQPVSKVILNYFLFVYLSLYMLIIVWMLTHSK